MGDFRMIEAPTEDSSKRWETLYVPAWVAEVRYLEPPVSINAAYTVFRGRKKLTAVGKMFKDGLATAISRCTYDWNTAHGLVYQKGRGVDLDITLGFPDLINKSWVEGKLTKTKGGAPRSKYKRKDASNYIKLIEDAVVHGSGIDDCNITRAAVGKTFDPEGYINIKLRIF